MRALYVPLGLIALLLAFSLWTGTYARRQTEDWIAGLERAEAAAQAENWQGAEAHLAGAFTGWKMSETFFHTIMDHAQLDAAESLFAGTEAACRERDEEEFRILLAQLATQLRLLAETQSVNLKNVL